METSSAAIEHSITTVGELERVVGVPHPSVAHKETDFTTPSIREFVDRARFFVLATSDSHGNCDASPRGDIESRIFFLDDRTLVIPDRPGNRRADSYRNILENPHVGILFVVPGMDEVLRLNGRARLTTDPNLLDRMAMKDKPAILGVVIEIDEVYVHCARAILRSRMWDMQTWPDAASVPSVKEMKAEQEGVSAGEDSRRRDQYYRSLLY